MRCGSPEKPSPDSPFVEALKGDDEWRHRGRFRYCSFCGSMHPDDAQQALMEGARVLQTTKSYKRYIRDHPDTDGGGRDKFYAWHISPVQETTRQRDLLLEVVRKGAAIMGDSPLGQACRDALAECEAS